MSELRDTALVYGGIIIGTALSVPLTVVYGPVVALVLGIGASLVGLLRVRSKIKRGQR